MTCMSDGQPLNKTLHPHHHRTVKSVVSSSGIQLMPSLPTQGRQGTVDIDSMVHKVEASPFDEPESPLYVKGFGIDRVKLEAFLGDSDDDRVDGLMLAIMSCVEVERLCFGRCLEDDKQCNIITIVLGDESCDEDLERLKAKEFPIPVNLQGAESLLSGPEIFEYLDA